MFSPSGPVLVLYDAELVMLPPLFDVLALTRAVPAG